MDRMREMLLRETNYRCGYCMMNITPVAYFTENRNSHEAKNTIPTYYQPYDCAHIEPYNEEDTETNSLLNLIALCKSCHWKSEPQHSNAIIPKEQLKALKLHWMIASGRFTRLEIDVLMGLNGTMLEVPRLFNSNNSNGEHHTHYRWIVLELEPHNEGDKVGYIVRPQVHIQNNLYFLLLNIIKANLIEECSANTDDQYHFYSTISFRLTHKGSSFCKKFHEAYQELDKIEI